MLSRGTVQVIFQAFAHVKTAIASSRSREAFFHIALVLPWVSPLASGPSPAVEPLLVSLLALCVLLVVAPSWISTDFRPALRAWAVAASLSAVLGILQYAGQSEFLVPWASPAFTGQAYGNLRQRNLYATHLVVGFVCLLALLQLGAVKRIVVPAALLLVVGNALSGSRIGALGLLLVCLLALIRPGTRRDTTRWLVACCLAVYVVAAALAPLLLQSTLGINAPSAFGRIVLDAGCGSRTILWSNVVHLIAQKPVLGWGLGELDYAHYITLYPGSRFCDILDNAHNLPLHLAVELGIPVAVLFCVAVCGFVWRRKPWREVQPCRQAAWLILALITLHSLVEYPLWYGPFQMALILCVASLWRKQSTAAAPAVNAGCTPRDRPQIWRLGIALGLAGASAYVWWDYHRVSQIYLPYEQRTEAYRDDTLMKISDSWLFRSQARFAELAGTPITRDRVEHVSNLAESLLHFSPEPRVIEALIESLVMLGRDDDAVAHLARYRAAFPQQYQAWRKKTAIQIPDG